MIPARRHLTHDGPAARRCPICQWVIGLDHDEALAMDRGALPVEYDPAAIEEAIQADEYGAELVVVAEPEPDVVDFDFVVAAPMRGGGPDDTMPALPETGEFNIVGG